LRQDQEPLVRKFLMVVDETPECMNAMRFAARRAEKTSGGVIMLYIIEPNEFQHWIGVAEVMRTEARDAAEARLLQLADEMKALTGVTPEFSIREGKKVEEVLGAITDDPDIDVLVLGAGEGEGPGPLISALVNKMGHRLPVPVTIVPGGMSMERIDAVC
jgi:nucleotide-binding universal stress UspA family protein